MTTENWMFALTILNTILLILVLLFFGRRL